MNRRNFLKSVGKAGLLIPAAPAICRAEWLMPVKAQPEETWTPINWEPELAFAEWHPRVFYQPGDIVMYDSKVCIVEGVGIQRARSNSIKYTVLI